MEGAIYCRKQQHPTLTAYAEESPLRTDIRSPLLLCRIRKRDIPSGCPKEVCRKTQQGACGDGEPFMGGVCD